jgi:hypothetical protein
MIPVIDVHTHMLTHEWVKMLEARGRPRCTLQEVRGGLRAIHLDGAPFMTPIPPMFDRSPIGRRAGQDPGPERPADLRAVARVPHPFATSCRRTPRRG